MFRQYVANREASAKLEAVRNILIDQFTSYPLDYKVFRNVFTQKQAQYFKGYKVSVMV